MKRLIVFALALGFSFPLLAKDAPSFSAELLSGGKVSLKDKLKPGRVLLLSFWASWCTPCLEELKHVKDKLAKEKDVPLDVLAVNVDTSETSSDVRPTIRLHKFEFPIVLDPKHEIFGKYQDNKTLPYSVLINPKGVIELTFNGYHDGMFEEIKKVAAKVAKENDAKPAKQEPPKPAKS